MMRIHKLKIQGFKSFIQEQTLDFSSLKTPGFYFLTGQNLIEPKLGANGVGKSSIYDSISWVLYGKTVSGLKAGSVGNWDGKVVCKVELQFELNGEEHSIIRTWKPNSLELAGVEVEQLKVDDLVGLTYESFLYTVLVGQFTVKFFDLSPADKLQLFTEVLDLDRWLKYSEKAKKGTAEQEGLIRVQEQNISYLGGQIEILSKQDYSEKISQWVIDKRNKIVQFESKILELKKKKQDLSNELKLLIEQHSASDITQIENEIKGLKGELNVVKNKSREIQIQMSSDSASLKYLNEEWVKLKNIKKSGVCPMCLQKADGVDMENHIKELADKIALVELDRSGLLEQSREIQGREKELEPGLMDLEDMLNEMKKKNNQAEKVIEDNKRNQQWVLKEISQVKQSVEGASQEENPYINLQEQNERDLVRLQKDLEIQKTALGDIRQKQEMYKYWEKGFKEIRLMVVEEVLKEFEIQTNNNLQRLGLSDWRIEYSVDQETKAGTVRKGFVVMVQSPVNNELVPFECWSGGEGQRIRLAGTLGLMDLIANRTPHRWSVEFWDEPTQFLSDGGIEDLMSVLRDRAYREEKQVILADHRDFITRGEFTGRINVVKDEGGSRVSFMS